MKSAGILVICLGLFLGFLTAMIPITVVVFGNSASCGPPLLRVVSQQQVEDPNEQALIDLCEDRSADRLPYAAGAVVIGALVGGGMLVASRGRTRDGATGAGDPPTAPPAADPPPGPPR